MATEVATVAVKSLSLLELSRTSPREREGSAFPLAWALRNCISLDHLIALPLTSHLHSR